MSIWVGQRTYTHTNTILTYSAWTRISFSTQSLIGNTKKTSGQTEGHFYTGKKSCQQWRIEAWMFLLKPYIFLVISTNMQMCHYCLFQTSACLELPLLIAHTSNRSCLRCWVSALQPPGSLLHVVFGVEYWTPSNAIKLRFPAKPISFISLRTG